MSEESVGAGTLETVERNGSSEATERSRPEPSARDGFAREADRARDALGIVDGEAILTLIE